MNSKLFLVMVLTLVLFSVNAQAFEIQNLGADFSVENQFEAKIYFENNGKQVISIQENNDFEYFNRFTRLRDNSYKWDLVFDRTGRPDIEKIIIIFPETTVTGNTVTINNFVIGFQDAIEQGFTVEVNQLGNDSQVILSNFSHISGVVTIDPTIIDSSELSKTNYGNTIVRDSSGNIFIVHEELVTASNTDIFVSKSTNDGNSFTTFNLTNSSDVNETLPHLDINSTDGLILLFDGNNSNNVFITTCSSGGCDSNSKFLDKINISQCAFPDGCSNSNIVTDVNDNSHMVYTKGGTGVFYRTISGFVGGSWGAEETVIVGGDIVGRDGTGILVAKNGSNRKLAFANTDNAQLRVGYFNTFQWTEVQLETSGIQEPATGFAGYDGNFYLIYTKEEGGVGTGKQIHFRQIDQTLDGNVIGNYSPDLNITQAGLDRGFVSSFQAADLNFHVLSSPIVGAIDVNIYHFVRTPNNVWTTSSIADANLLVSDSNRTFNPLIRFRDYDGGVLSKENLPLFGNVEIDYVYLTSNNSTGDPSTLLFDSNFMLLATGIIANFTTNPASPLIIDPENNINNVQADLNSSTNFFGTIVDINYLWKVDGEEISTDQNVVWDFNGGNLDFNVSLVVSGNDGIDTFTSQADQNLLLRTALQGVDFNFTNQTFVNNVDVNFQVTADGIINFAVWGGTDFDINASGTIINKVFTQDKITQVCVIVNGTGDINKLLCQDYIVTRWLVSPALDEQTDASLTPTITNYDRPTQSYTHSNDINVFTFYGPEVSFDTNANFLIDFNASYFTRNYFFDLDSNQTFFTLQPRLPLVANSIQSTIFTIDNFTRDTVPGIQIQAIRILGGQETIVESTVSDSTGTATMSFVATLDYTLRFLDADGKILSEGPLGPKSTTLYAFIGTAEINFVLTPIGELVITWTPSQSTADANKSALSRFSQIINQVDLNITLLTVRITQGDINFFVQDFNFLGTDTNIFQDVNVLDANAFNLFVIEIIAQTPDGNFSKSFSYNLVFATGGSLITNIRKMKDEFGQTTVLIIAIIITLLAIGSFAKVATTDFNSLGIVALLILGIFTYFEWIPLTIYLVAILMGSGALIYRWVR